MKIEDFLIKNEELRNTATEKMLEESYIKEKVREWLNNTYNEKFVSYNFNFRPMVTEAIKKDLKTKKAIHVLNILSSEEEKRISYIYALEEVSTEIKVDNTVIYYPEFKMAVVSFITSYGNVTSYHCLLFSADESLIQGYFDHIKRSYREKKSNEIKIFQCESYGVYEKVQYITHAVTRNDVFLEKKLKQDIFRSIDSFFQEDKAFYSQFELPYKRGLLLYGSPGNGKTTLVKSIVNSIDAPVAYWQITEHTNSSSMSDVFERAEKLAPMVLVIEDVDSMPERARSTFLNLLDGATSKEGLFVIATTNYPEKIDPALINRAGRFDQSYEIPLPNEEIRYDYLKNTKLSTILETQEQLKEIAEKTEGFSVTQLAEFYKLAALSWYYDKVVDVQGILDGMKETNAKQKKNTWDSKKANSTMGFAH